MKTKKEFAVKSMKKDAVSDIMIKDLKTVTDTTTLIEAHMSMESKGVHHLLVVDEKGILVGVLSDRDVKKFSSPFAGSKLEQRQDRATMSIPISKIMTKKVFSCGPNDSIKTCTEVMLEKSIHSVPIVHEKGKLVGLVTATE